jgi:oxygen-dependent protoporphyrinogen oxidase
MPRVVVIGGGISGLAAAREVRTLLDGAPDLDVVVLEGSPLAGGKLRVESVAGVEVDVGAEALLARRPEGVGLVSALGLDGRRISPTTTATQVFAGGALHPLPARTLMGIPASLDAVRQAGVLSTDALTWLMAERSTEPLKPLTEDVAVGELVRTRLGDEVVQRLVDPLLGGVYAGRADELSLQATIPMLAAKLRDGGSLMNVAGELTEPPPTSGTPAPMFTSLRGGLGRVVDRLALSGLFEVRTETIARGVRRTPTGFVIEIGSAAEPAAIEADAVIVATPAAKAAQLLRDVAPAAATDLAAIQTASMAVITLAFREADLPVGSGFLVGSAEGLTVKAATFSTQKWPMETGGLIVMRASVGRAGDTTTLWREDEDLIALVRADLHRMIGLDATPIDALVTRWGGGLPQYAVGHVQRVERIRAAVAQVPGLAVCGASYDGVGIPACIGTATAAAARAVEALRPGGAQ